jgi:hypothetical protein
MLGALSEYQYATCLNAECLYATCLNVECLYDTCLECLVSL